MSAPPPASIPRPRPKGLRGFLRGPEVRDRRTLAFLIAIFVVVGSVFAIVFVTWSLTHPARAPAPVTFTAATMVSWNATLAVTSVEGGPYPWQNFTVQFSFNNFNSPVVPLAPSGVNASVIIGTTAYHLRWNDTDGNGAISVGDTFAITGVGAGLSPLSYCIFSLIWDGGNWTSMVYWVTSSPND